MKPGMNVFDHVRKSLSLALDLDPAEVEQIEKTTTAADLDKWDSLSHLRLILELESCFGITFDDEQIGQLASVGRIMQVVESNGR